MAHRKKVHAWSKRDGAPRARSAPPIFQALAPAYGPVLPLDPELPDEPELPVLVELEP